MLDVDAHHVACVVGATRSHGDGRPIRPCSTEYRRRDRYPLALVVADDDHTRARRPALVARFELVLEPGGAVGVELDGERVETARRIEGLCALPDMPSGCGGAVVDLDAEDIAVVELVDDL